MTAALAPDLANSYKILHEDLVRSLCKIAKALRLDAKKVLENRQTIEYSVEVRSGCPLKLVDKQVTINEKGVYLEELDGKDRKSLVDPDTCKGLSIQQVVYVLSTVDDLYQHLMGIEYNKES